MKIENEFYSILNEDNFLKYNNQFSKLVFYEETLNTCFTYFTHYR